MESSKEKAEIKGGSALSSHHKASFAFSSWLKSSANLFHRFSILFYGDMWQEALFWRGYFMGWKVSKWVDQSAERENLMNDGIGFCFTIWSECQVVFPQRRFTEGIWTLHNISPRYTLSSYKWALARYATWGLLISMCMIMAFMLTVFRGDPPDIMSSYCVHFAAIYFVCMSHMVYKIESF